MRAQNVKAVFVSSLHQPHSGGYPGLRTWGSRWFRCYVGSLGPDGSGAETYLGYLR
jgi:ribonuclease BN (tRNA processing enzyme)